MEIKQYAIGAGIGVAVTSAVVWVLAKSKEREEKEARARRHPPKPDPDIDLFKQTMEDRYVIPDEVKISAEAKKALLKGIHDNIKADISKLYEKKFHKDLNSYNEELFKKHH